MRKLIIIEFNPQNIGDTNKAISTALENEKNSVLKPSSNLIDMECLILLNKNNFYGYDSSAYGKVFELEK